MCLQLYRPGHTGKPAGRLEERTKGSTKKGGNGSWGKAEKQPDWQPESCF